MTPSRSLMCDNIMLRVLSWSRKWGTNFRASATWTLILFFTFLQSACVSTSEKKNTLFRLVPASETGIGFENRLKETEEFNIIEYLYYYNGAGVAIGDINNDGLADVYFTANQQPNRLYLNHGHLKFEDITNKAGVAGTGNWKTGVTMADVNGDGYLDIYVCGVGNYKNFDTHNQLFVNNGDLTFTERAEEYGLDFKGLSTQASFFDYDGDGDLDVYLLNHSVHSVRSYGNAAIRNEPDSLAGDRLFENTLEQGTPRFADVTAKSGIYSSHIGYGLGIATADINMDGWPDIYVSNDFRENDYLYINLGDGTFREEIRNRLAHSSRFSMGNDVADFNNDGLPDIITVDMMPREEKIIKASVGEDSYEVYKFKLGYGYHYQVSRNALQLNVGRGHFSDIAWLSGVAATDWSWAPLLADFDNDGLKDLFVSNGIVRRPNDLNYLNFISSDSAKVLTDLQLLQKMPQGKVGNYVFRNVGNLSFEDHSSDWGVNAESCSNGAAYADLDNDGDLDLVVNNIDNPAHVLENTLRDSARHFIRVVLKGKNPNAFGIGAKVFAFVGPNRLYQEVSPTRGFQSSVDQALTFGIGNAKAVDSLWIIWPDKSSESMKNLPVNQTVVADIRKAGRIFDFKYSGLGPPLLEQTAAGEPPFRHREDAFVAFNRESLMPHMVTAEGPRMAVGDVNGDGLDDYFVGGAKGQSSALYLQKGGHGFVRSNYRVWDVDSLSEDVGSVLFDADGDKDLDLVVVSGGNEVLRSPLITPRMYMNDGRGLFTKAKGRLPEIYVNASCVLAGDADRDGDRDLFIGGRVTPAGYGLTPASYILLNDGKGYFSDASAPLLPGGQDIGMVTDGAWTDVDGDQRMDLILVGEWMPPTILLQQADGTFANKTKESGLLQTEGWWNAVVARDFDLDGDVDFVSGNLGLNSRLKASTKEPVQMVVGDFDGNGSPEQIITYYNRGVSYPFVSRDQLVKQIPPLRKKFLKYGNYVNARIEDILAPSVLSVSVKKSAYCFQSSYFENVGGRFTRHDLPIEAQAFPVFSLLADDVNGDGNADLLAVGNLYATQPDFGRYDAGYGLILLSDGKGNFKSLGIPASGFVVEGEGRDVKTVRISNTEKIYLVSRNDSSILAFKAKR